MNDEMMFEYLIQMGAMRPEEAELKKKQAMVDALRGNAMAPMEGQMVSGHYVPKGLAGAAAQLGQGYMASKAQSGVDQQSKKMNAAQAGYLSAMQERLRRKRLGLSGDGTMDTADYGAGY